MGQKGRKISDFIPEEKETKMVQGRVDREVVDRVKAVLDKKNIGWNEFLTACLLSYLAEERDD